MLELKNVTKTFGTLKALDDLTMTVPKGAVYGLVGPNGAGKSTAIRHVLGVYRPDSGSITLDGGDARKTGIDCTSGRVNVSLASFGDLRIDLTSGDIAASLPSRPGFEAEISTTSGKVESDIALKQEGRRYSCGDASARLRIHTTSGNIHVTERP